MEYSVLNPRGLRQSMDRNPLSPRLPSLRGKVVYCIEMFNPRVMKELTKRLPEYIPGLKTVYKEKSEGFAGSDLELLDEIEQKADAVICGTVMGGGSGMYGVYWAIEIEKRGIPLVYLVGEALPSDRTFADVIRDSAEKRGMPALRTTVIPLVEESRVNESMTDKQFEKILLQIIDALTKPLTKEEQKAGKMVPPKQPRIALTGTLAEVQDYFYNQRWTDGLPIIPPTEELVEAFLRRTKHSPEEVVTNTMWPEEFTATVEKVAIVGAMAGCKPEYMPLLLAIVDAFAKSSFGVFLPSDSSPALMTVVNGPIRNEIGMNAGRNAMGPCNQANATIGRFANLSIVTLGGLWPQINDLSAQGNPTRYSFCFAENEEKNPWEPFHVSLGHKAEDSAVTLFTGGWSHANAMAGFVPIKNSLDNIAKGQVGSTILMAPGMARLCASDGMSKKDVEQFIWEHAVEPVSVRKKMPGFRPGEYDNLPDDALVPVYPRKAVKVIVVGGETGSGIAQVWQLGNLPPSTSSVDKWR